MIEGVKEKMIELEERVSRLEAMLDGSEPTGEQSMRMRFCQHCKVRHSRTRVCGPASDS